MRTASLQLHYDSTDISTAIAPFVEGFSYTDYASGKADDLQITMEDCDQRWKNGWHPRKGALLRASLSCTVAGRTSTLECGSFEIDELEPSGPPERVVIRAASAAIGKSLRREKKSRAWENTSLQALAAALADQHGLALFFQGPGLEFKRLDQRDESDLAFLQRLCNEHGLNIKISDEKLIIFSGAEFEAKDASFSLTRGDRQIVSYSFKNKADDIYHSCQIDYFDPLTKELKSHTFTPPDAPEIGQVLKVTTRVESLAAAQRLAVTSLRRKNKKEVTATLVLVGDPAILAGLNLALSGFGVYDGKYFIDEAGHAARPAYLTTIKLHKVLGY